MMTGPCGRAPIANLNATPLADVLIVLIITFMVIPLLTPRELEARVTHPSRSDGASAIVASVDATGNIEINRDRVDSGDLRSRLEEIFPTSDRHSCLLKCDLLLDFARVAGIMDVARSSGIEEVGLVTDEFEGRQ